MDNSFERYACQITLPDFGETTQRRLQSARVLVIGAGGLGCPALQYLASSGIGTLGIADHDTVSLSNLHRQILYSPADVGRLKVAVAKERLQQQNPDIQIIDFPQRVTSENILRLVSGFDVIIEGTDNFETKVLINDACVLQQKTLIYGAIYQYDGQVAVWNAKQADGSYSVNYRDVFTDVLDAQVPNCREGGVIPTLAGIVGCMQANEAIKFFIKPDSLLAGKLWMINLLKGNTHVIQLKNQTTVQIDSLQNAVALMEWEDVQQRNLELIDVRTKEEHLSSHIGGKNIPLDKLESDLSEIDFSLPVLCYCSSGKRSVIAARILQKQFPRAQIYSLKGGVDSIR